jgi:hypothetical protein
MFAGTLALAQTVRPLIDENTVGGPGKKASGRIEYVNDTLQPLAVVLESKSFTVSDTGDLSYQPLDPAVHVKFSATSFRIPPQQSFFVFYEATSDKLPSWFVVYAAFSGFKEKTEQGFRIQILLPHTIYLLPKQKLQKDDLEIRVAEFHAREKKVVVRLSNKGPAFGRVLETSISGPGNSSQAGFPIFPFSERQVEFPWEPSADPRKVTLRFLRFSLERAIQPAQPANAP